MVVRNVNGVVAYMLNAGVLDDQTAVKADEYIVKHIGDESDGTMDVQVLDEKTGVVLWEFHRLEVSGFLDWAYLAGILHLDPVAFLLNKVNAGRANGIARRQVERRKLTGENIAIGMRYYAAAAHNLLNEVCYGSTGWVTVKLESMVLVNHVFEGQRRNKLGMSKTFDSKRQAYMVNGEIVVRKNTTSTRVFNALRKCIGTLVSVSPRGMMSIPCTRVSHIDDMGKTHTEITGLDPTLSFLRMTYVLVSNAFFVLELGPISTKHESLSAEFKDARATAGYRQTEVDQFAVIAESDQFSKQEKHMTSALGIVVGDIVNNIAGFMQAGKGMASAKHQLSRAWYEAFCGVANTEPHIQHFRKMVKNFQKHCRRFFGTPESVEIVELSIKSILNRDKLVKISDVIGINPITEKATAAELVHVRPFAKQTFSQLWEDMKQTVNYCPRVVQTTEPIPVTDFPCNVKLDTVNDAAAEVADDHCLVSHPVGYVDYILNFSDNSVPNSLTDLERRLVGCGLPKLVKATTPNTTPKTKAWLLWDRLRGEFRRIATVDVACEYADAI